MAVALLLGGSAQTGGNDVGDDSDAGGRFLSTASSSTLIGCDGAPLPAIVTATTRAAFDGATLVLLGHDGHEEGRLARG